MDLFKEKPSNNLDLGTKDLWLYSYNSNIVVPSFDHQNDYENKCNEFVMLKQITEEYLKEIVLAKDIILSEVKNQNKKNAENSDRSVISLEVSEKKKKFSKDYKCTIDGCGRQYTSIDSLALHIKAKHENWVLENGATRKVLAQFRKAGSTEQSSEDAQSTFNDSNDLDKSSYNSSNPVSNIDFDNIINWDEKIVNLTSKIRCLDKGPKCDKNIIEKIFINKKEWSENSVDF